MAIIGKTREEIKQDLINRVASYSNKLTDFSTGSVIDTILSAISNEIEEAYYFKEDAYNKSLLITAEEEDLDNIAAGFGITRSGAEAAVGIIEFSRTTPYAYDVTIPAGTIVTTDPYGDSVYRFETDEEIVLPVGEISVTGGITALEAGTSSNVAADTITFIESTVAYIDGCNNDNDMTGGLEEETDTAFRQRIVDTLTANPRCTKQAIEAYARGLRNISTALLIDQHDGPGTAALYVATTGGTPTSEDLAYVEYMVDNYAKPVGIDIEYNGSVTITTDVTATVYYDSNYNSAEIKADVEEQIEDFITLKDCGDNVYLAEIASTAMRVPGVLNIYDIEINSSAADLSIANTEIARPGTITITVV